MIRKVFSAAILCGAAPLAAQGNTQIVTAREPAVMAEALASVGYVAVLTTDLTGAPLIETHSAGWPWRIIFYDCDEATLTNCESVQFSAGFDRKDAWTADQAIQVSTRLRFAAVSLDEEGDPYISWDLVTGEGIPTKVFLTSVERFIEAMEATVDLAFPSENGE